MQEDVRRWQPFFACTGCTKHCLSCARWQPFFSLYRMYQTLFILCTVPAGCGNHFLACGSCGMGVTTISCLYMGLQTVFRLCRGGAGATILFWMYKGWQPFCSLCKQGSMGDGNHLLHVQDARNIVYLVHGGGVATIFYPVQGWRGWG